MSHVWNLKLGFYSAVFYIMAQDNDCLVHYTGLKQETA